MSTEAVLRLLRVRPSTEPPVTEEEITNMIAQGTEAGIFEETEQDLVERVFRLGDRRVSALMTPRIDIVWIDINDPIGQIHQLIREHERSRFPISEGTLDNVPGILQVGQTVLAIGNPLGITQTVTSGIVSALNRNVPEGEGGGVILNAIQMDAPINPGNSGGALVDLRGDVVGIPTLIIVNPSFNMPASGMGFSIPANRAAFIVPQLIQLGKVTHYGLANLGLTGTSVDTTVAAQLQLPITQGVLIASVNASSPAARAGLKSGDIIVRVDDTAVANESALLDSVLNRNPGERVTLQIYRGNQQMTVNVTLGRLQVTAPEGKSRSSRARAAACERECTPSLP